MARVRCTIIETRVKDRNGKLADGTRAECMHCDNKTEAVGRDEKSIKRCLAEMHRTCPEGQDNFYVED